jgi:hypothetical protein
MIRKRGMTGGGKGKEGIRKRVMIRRRGWKEGEGKERNEKVGYDKKESGRREEDKKRIRKRGMIRRRGRKEGR